MLSQEHSPLFRPPGELRNQIYYDAFMEPGGYTNKGTLVPRKRRTSKDTPINLSLSYTCKRIYAETRGLAFKINRITFMSQRDDSLLSANEESRMTRLESLSDRYYYALSAMLSWAYMCVTFDHLATLRRLHPHNEDVRLLHDLDENTRQGKLRSYGIVRGSGTERSMATVGALRDLLRLISHHPNFHTLTAKEYAHEIRNEQMPHYWYGFAERTFTEYDEGQHFPKYAPDSQETLLGLVIEPWSISIVTKLDSLKELLPREFSDSGSDSESENHPEIWPQNFGRKLSFSATVCAVHFLKKVPTTIRLLIRHLQIYETQHCGSFQPSHTHGLIPFCAENPRLRVETHVDVVKVVLWGSSYPSA